MPAARHVCLRNAMMSRLVWRQTNQWPWPSMVHHGGRLVHARKDPTGSVPMNVWVSKVCCVVINFRRQGRETLHFIVPAGQLHWFPWHTSRKRPYLAGWEPEMNCSIITAFLLSAYMCGPRVAVAGELAQPRRSTYRKSWFLQSRKADRTRDYFEKLKIKKN